MTGPSTIGTVGATPLPHPQYAQTVGYARTHMYLPFDISPSTPAAALQMVRNLEALMGTDIEVLGLGLPNGMGSPASTLAKWASCPQAKVWALTGIPNGNQGGGTLAALNAGTYDSLIDGMGAGFAAIPGAGAAFGGHGEHWCRDLWEFDYSNYTWGIGVNGNTAQNQADGMDRIHTRMYAAGYRGGFIVNAGGDPRPMFNLLAHPELVGALGIDFYNTNGGTSNEFVWANVRTKRLKLLSDVATFCRANNLRLMFPECGTEVKPDPWHTRPPNAGYWNDFLGFVNDNPDVCDAPGLFNEEMGGSSGATTSDIAMAYCGLAGTKPSSVAALGSYHNTSTTAAWTWTDSPLKPDLAEFRANFVAGSWQKLDDPGVPPVTVAAVAPTSYISYNNEMDLFA